MLDLDYIRKYPEKFKKHMEQRNVSILAENILNLDKDKLLRSARKEWCPTSMEIKSLKQFNLPFGGMLVNTYLIWDEVTRKAWMFDTGPDAGLINDFIEMKNLEIDAIFLTHTHHDHIACLDDLKQKTRNSPIFVHKSETFGECEWIEEGFWRNLR